MFLKQNLFVLCGLLIFLAGCNKGIEGDLNENILPETYVVADTIIRSGDNRFVSQIDISWSGTDADGYVAGYEYSFNGTDWGYTERQDSTFLIELPEGEDTFDVEFSVRAVDNRGGKDATPARLVYPVKNSPPAVEFVYQDPVSGTPSRNPVKSFPVLKIEWLATDRDGTANIDKLELALNDTNLSVLEVAPEYSSALIEAKDPRSDNSDCNVYLGSVLKLQEKALPGLKMNDTNVFFIKVYDKVGVSSKFVQSAKIYIQKVESDVLLVNGYSRNIGDREQFYIDGLNAAGFTNFDTIRVNEVVNNNYTSLAADNPTQARIFSLYKTMIWFGQDAPYLLTLAQRTTSEFFNNGGTMFASVYFNSGIDKQSQYLDFTPIDSLVGAFFINKDAEVKAEVADWPTLSTDRVISSARPFQEIANATAIYNAEMITQNGPWEGKSTIMASKSGQNGKPQFILCSVELYRLNANNNMAPFFTKLMQELGQ
ncbi:MAG: hypothetical protein KDC92_08735 [Bacteroidetes bacterium]|nr:hypothetical protein [Bacteroidota bacterium]